MITLIFLIAFLTPDGMPVTRFAVPIVQFADIEQCRQFGEGMTPSVEASVRKHHKLSADTKVTIRFNCTDHGTKT